MKRVHPTPHVKAGKAPKTKPDSMFPRPSQIASANPGRPSIATAAFKKPKGSR
jgi:hypothetical protein